MNLLKMILAVSAGFVLGAVIFHVPTVKAQGGANVTIQVVKDVSANNRTTVQADGSQIVGFSCENNTSGLGNKCYLASVK